LDLIEPFEQRLAAPRRDGEWLCVAAWGDNLLSFQVDRQLPIWGIWLDRGRQLHNHIFIERLFDRYNGVPELITFDHGVLGSSPSAITKRINDLGQQNRSKFWSGF
jgi:hypothetical protein